MFGVTHSRSEMNSMHMIAGNLPVVHGQSSQQKQRQCVDCAGGAVAGLQGIKLTWVSRAKDCKGNLASYGVFFLKRYVMPIMNTFI